MNIRYVLRQQGLLYFVLSTVLLAIAAWSAWSCYRGDKAEQGTVRVPAASPLWVPLLACPNTVREIFSELLLRARSKLCRLRT